MAGARDVSRFTFLNCFLMTYGIRWLRLGAIGDARIRRYAVPDAVLAGAATIAPQFLLSAARA